MSSPLAPPQAVQSLGAVGRLLYDTRSLTLWERDTATLPRVFRGMRRRYRDFARDHLSPLALEAEAPPPTRRVS